MNYLKKMKKEQAVILNLNYKIKDTLVMASLICRILEKLIINSKNN